MKTLIYAILAIVSIAPCALAEGHYPANEYKADNFNAGDWLIRVRGLGVIPQEDSNLSIGGSVEVDNSVVPEIA